MDEITPIPGFEDYGATRDGRIFSRKKGLWRQLALHAKGKGGDYLKVKLYTTSCDYWQVAVHELIAITFIGPKPAAPKGTHMEVNHKDFDKRHNDVDNLEWLTSQGNHEHAVRGGRYDHLRRSDEQRRATRRAQEKRKRDRQRAARGCFLPRYNPRFGERGNQAKLTNQSVAYIRALGGLGVVSLSWIGCRFGVSKNTIWKILHGVKWSRVT
jgi:hypothetical protein